MFDIFVNKIIKEILEASCKWFFLDLNKLISLFLNYFYIKFKSAEFVFWTIAKRSFP